MRVLPLLLLLVCGCERKPAVIEVRAPSQENRAEKEAAGQVAKAVQQGRRLEPITERKQTLALRATGYDEGGHFLGTIPVSWTSADPAVATVDNKGVVHPVRSGDVEIAARLADGSVQGSVVVPVRLVGKVVITPAAAQRVRMGKNLQLAAEVLDDRGQALADTPVRWSSTSFGARVDPEGRSVQLEGLALGKGVVSATAGGVAGKLDIEVVE